MAFKMKGSAFKLNNVATKSALAMKSPLEQKKELSVTDKIKAGVSAVADWEGPFSDYSLSDGYKHKKKQIRKGDEISSRDTKGTGAAGKMKSPLEQTEASALKQQLTVNGRVMKIKGKEKRGNQRYPSDQLIPGRAQWIRDNFGRGLSEKRKKEAEISYFNAHAPEKLPVVEKTEPIYYGEEKVKETKYPTNKLQEGSGADTELMNKNLGEEVWDPTLNGGEGGYIRRKAVDSEVSNETDNYSL